MTKTNEHNRNFSIVACVPGYGAHIGCYKKIKEEKDMVKLANATMHDQSQFLDAFRSFGFDVEPTPRLRPVSGAREAYELAYQVVEQSRKEGFDGLLLGGRTDLMVYIAIQAPAWGLELYIAETERLRDANDRFIFNLKDITKIYVSHPVDLVGAAIAAEVDTLRLFKEVKK